MRVLLVEDNPADALLVQSLLRQAGGIEVHTAPTLSAGLEDLVTFAVDVVLLDLNLPDTRGLATLSRLLDARDDVAVVVLSGHDDENLAYRALQAGAQDYLVKGTQDPTLLRRVLRYATERKRLEAQLRQLNVELEARVERRTRELAQANRELESFAYSVSHDLQAPLRTIGGFAEILATDFADQLDDEAREYLHRMRDAGRHMGELLDALLELSRVSRFVLKPVPVDLADLARAVFADIARTAPERRTSLEIQGAIEVQGDPPHARNRAAQPAEQRFQVHPRPPAGPDPARRAHAGRRALLRDRRQRCGLRPALCGQDCSASFSACTAPTSSRAPASAWPMCAGS
jgi:DNA-binding response OmpR family regulator